MSLSPEKSHAELPRKITHRTHGRLLDDGMITRLMHPTDLGQLIKPFVFLDLYDTDNLAGRDKPEMPLHPHSGIATVSVLIEGSSHYEDPIHRGPGTLSYGGVEWNRTSRGIWHGQERIADDVPRIQGFQLWLALPAELENAEPENYFFEEPHVPKNGPAYVIIGNHQNVQSPVPAPEGINYLLVSLRAGESWSYQPPAGHSIGWLALAQGSLDTSEAVTTGELVIFESGESPITLQATGESDAVFVLGSAVPHPYTLHLSRHSVHTSAQALEAGLQRIAELQPQLETVLNQRTAAGTIPILR